MLKRTLLPSSAIFLTILSAQQKSFCNASDSAGLIAFSPKEFRSFKISKITTISPNTKTFEILLPTANHEMGMATASCFMIKGNDEDGKVVARPYTPTSLNDDKGKFEILIKAYPQGKVSSYLHSKKEGDTIEVKGPFPKIKYIPNMKKKIGMIAGGTGITPMLQVIKEILKNPNDKTEIYLVFANNAEEDILLKEVLDSYAAKYKNFKVTYVLSQASSKWNGLKGFVSLDIVKKFMPTPSSDNMVFVCGITLITY
jgi:cytochrome-b5 reductase